MKGQNIKKYQQKELNLMCKSDKKTRNYIFSLPRDKSREYAKKILTSDDKTKPNKT